MTIRTNPDGTIDVRVALTVQVDPDAWAQYMMDLDPSEVLQKEVRRDVKRYVRNIVADRAMHDADYGEDDGVQVPIGTVTVQGLYEVSRD
jgi:hypothetical protein